MERKVIAVDIDEVLCRFVPQIALFHNDKYGTSLTSDDFHSYYFSKVWGGSNEEAVAKVHDFFETKYFKDIECIVEAKAVLDKYKDRFDFHCVTSRQHVIEKQTRMFIEKHFPDVFKEIHFGNHYSKDSPNPFAEHESKRSKPEMCSDINAVCLIDDSIMYALQCSKELGQKGFKVVLFGDYPWNQGVIESTAVTRAATWEAVDTFLATLLSK